MKTWKAAELVELNIAETAWGLCPSDKECGFIIGTHDHSNCINGGDDTDKGTDTPATPDTLS